MMKKYLEGAIEDFEEDIVRLITSPAQKGIFAVDKHSKRLGT